MARGTVLSSLLFWLFMVIGVAALAPALILPAWVERQAQLECLQARLDYLRALEARLANVKKQIDHLNNDPAYVLRLAEEDFGGTFRIPNVESIRVDPPPDRADPVAVPASTATPPPADDALPDLAPFIERILQRYPHAQLLMHPATRPVLMAMGGGLIVTALLLLAWDTPPPRSPADDGPPEVAD